MTQSTYVARSPADLIALAPSILGFVPEESAVLMTFGDPGEAFHGRVDLPPKVAHQREVAAVLVNAMHRNGVRRCALLVYSEHHARAASQGRVFVEHAEREGIEVFAVLRVGDGRYFWALEDDPSGTPCDPENHPFAVQRVVDGAVVRPSRAALMATLDPLEDVDDLRAVLAAAAKQFARWRRARIASMQLEARKRLRRDAEWLVALLGEVVPEGTRPDAADLGRVLAGLTHPILRDVALAPISRSGAVPYVEFWRGVVQRAPEPLLAAPAAVLAFAAWQAGDGALAWCALDRCMAADPEYGFAAVMGDVLRQAVPPKAWKHTALADLDVFSDAFVDPAA